MSADIKAAKKETLKVGFLTVAVSAIGILDPPIQKKPDDGNPSLLLIAYLLVVSTIFSMGLFLLLLSLILPRMPSLVPAVKILVWVDLILLHIALTLKKSRDGCVCMSFGRSINGNKEEDGEPQDSNGKQVFVRVDLNVALDNNLNIAFDTMVRASVPTIIKYLI
ncbi:hypothetical protein AAC387_Pa03g2696 [Persea americana]